MFSILSKKLNKCDWIPVGVYIIFSLCIFILQIDHIIFKAALYVSGYVVIAYTGYILKAHESSRMHKNLLILGWGITLVITFFINFKMLGEAFNLAENKYPPSIYYISYGLITSFILFEVMHLLKTQLGNLGKVFTRISSLSFDVYFWHIFGLFLTSNIEDVLVKSVLVVLIAVTCALIFDAARIGIRKVT